MAKSTSINFRSLQDHYTFSERRVIRINEPDETVERVYTDQYCRRMWPWYSAELARFLTIAMGSACELEYQMILANDLNFIYEVVYSRLTSDLVEIKKMLTSFIKKLKTDN